MLAQIGAVIKGRTARGGVHSEDRLTCFPAGGGETQRKALRLRHSRCAI